MTRRVGVIGFFHESNTFAATRVSAADVGAHELFGADIVSAHENAGTVVAGYLAAGAELGWDVVPLSYCELVPSGLLLPAARQRVMETFRRVLDAYRADGGTLDALLVCLHGAAVALDEPDLDGALLELLRAEVGSDVLVAVTLDLHANLTARMVEGADVLVGYRTNPHVDARERAVEATHIVNSCLREGWRPARSWVPVPAVVSILAQGTNEEPMASLMAAARVVADQPGVVSVSLFEGFPWADVADVGVAAVVLTRDRTDVGERSLARLAAHVWAAREAFRASAPRANEVFAPQAAASMTASPTTTLLLDVGDNVGGGAPGTTTWLFAAALEANVSSVVAIVRDEEAAAAAARAGTGAAVELTVGDPPLVVRGQVGAVSDGLYEDRGPTHVGHRYFDAGRSAVLHLDGGQTLVVCSNAIMPSSAEQLRHLGLEPGSFEFVCAKGVHSPLAGYLPYVDHVMWVDTPGVTCNDLGGLAYRSRPRPLFPLDVFDEDPALTVSTITPRSTASTEDAT